MSKAIRRYYEDEQKTVISRRLASRTYGLGFWSAVETQGKDAMSENVRAQRQENPERFALPSKKGGKNG